MKKTLVFLLIFTLIISAVPARAQDGGETEGLEENSAVLSVYGISITANDKGYVTNKDLAFTMISMLNFDAADFNSAADTLRAAEIIPSGARFLAQTEVTADEAYEYCINALGYGARTNYGANTEILRKLGAGVKSDTKLTEAAWSKIVRNALTIPCSELTGIKRGGANYKEGRNIIEKYHGGLYVRDIIYATDTAAVGGYETFVKKDSVYVGGTYMYADKSDIDRYLGCRAEVFAVGDGDDDYTVGAYVITDNNITETVRCRDVDYALGFDAADSTEYKTSPMLSYFNENGKRVSEHLSGSVTVLYNDNAAKSLKNSDFEGENGTVRLIDSDRDGIYDVVYIRKYVSGIVAAADNNGKTLTLEGGDAYDFGSAKRLAVTEGERAAEFSAVGAGSVIGIYASEDKSGKAEIEIFTNVIHGKVTSVAADNLKAEIDGTEYDCVSSIGSLKPGFTYSFVTDNDGVLIYRTGSGSDMSYAYFTEFSIDGSIDTPVKIRVLDLNNTYHTYAAANKVKYTGFDENGVWLEDKTVTKSRFADILTANFTAHTLVKIAYDGDVLKKLSCAKYTSGNEDYKGYDEDSFTMERHIEGKDSRLVRTGRSLSPTYRAMPNVTVCIHDNLNDKDDIEVCTYSLGNANILVESSYCMSDGYVYDSNKKLIASVFVLQYDPVVNNNMVQNCNTLTGASRMLVDKVTRAINSEGEETFTVSGYMMDGRLVRYTARNENVTQKFNSAWCAKNPCTVGQLKRGDVIIPVVGRTGDMVNFYLLLKFDENNRAPEHYKAYNGATSDQHDNGINTVFGEIKKNFDNNTVTFQHVPDTQFLINGTIYVCDFESGRIFQTDSGEYIRDASTESADTVLMIRNHHLAELTVIYRY